MMRHERVVHLVGDFVGMAFAYGFRGEEESASLGAIYLVMHLVGGGEVCSVWRRSVWDQRVSVGRSVSSQSSFKQGLDSEFFFGRGVRGKSTQG